MERAWSQTSEKRRGYFNTSGILVEAVRVQKRGASEAAGRQREPQDAVAAWPAPFALCVPTPVFASGLRVLCHPTRPG